MQKMNLIEVLRRDLEKLECLTDALVQDLHQINECVLAGRFIPKELGTKVSESLNETIQLQENIGEQFSRLEIGKFPEKAADIEKILEDYQEKLELKNKYMDTVKFFMSLHSDEEEIEKLLDGRKTQLALLNLEELESEEEFEQKLKPYILLKNTMQEKDARKKYSLLYQLTSFFEEAIFYGVGSGKITSFQDELCCTSETEKAAEDFSAAEMPETEFEIKETEALETEPSPVQTEPEKKMKISEEMETKTEPEVSSEAKEPSPETESLPKTEEDTTDDNWENLGIEDASLVCYPEKPGILKTAISPKASDKFGVSKFKNDIGKQSCLAKVDCLTETVNGCAYSRESIVLYKNQNAGYYDQVSEKLYQLGYLKRYLVEGMGEFYTLSARGVKAFTSKDSLSFIQKHSLDREKPQMAGREEIEDTANSAISRLLLCSCYAKTKRIDSRYIFKTRKVCTAEDYFLLFLPCVQGEFMVAYTGIVSENQTEFLHLRKKIENLQADHLLDYLIIVEPDRELALHVAKWLRAVADPKTTVGYSAYGETEVFDVSTEEVLNIPSAEEPDVVDKDVDGGAAQEEVEDQETSVHGSDNMESAADTEKEAEDTDNPPETEVIKEEIGEPENRETDKAQKIAPAAILEETSVSEAVEKKETEASGPARQETEQKYTAVLSGGVLTETEKQKYNTEYQEMLASGKFYAATAFLKSLSKEFSYYESVYCQAAYALNDPMEKCSYSSDNIISVFYEGDSPVSDYYVISAAVRNYFYDQFNYDYSLPQLQSTISGSSILKDIHAVEEIIYALQKFKTEFQAGMDRYADYREKEQSVLEEQMEKTKREAKGYYENYSSGNMKENASHKRFIETSRLLLGPKSDLSEYLQMVIEDNRDMLDMLEEFLSENYVKDQAAICEENIDSAKIECILDEYWDRAAQNIRLVKKSSDLMSSLRMNLFKKVQKVVGVLCNYVFLCRSNISTKNDPAYMEYKKSRKNLLENIEESLDALSVSTQDTTEIMAGKKVLSETLTEIQSRISGAYKEGSYKYFYINFLKNDKILLDEEFLPILDEVLELPEFSVRNRIRRHYEESDAENKSWEERIDDIYRQEDNYGSAELIFQYVENQELPFENLEEQHSRMEQAVVYPESDMENKRKEFIEDLELAQSYGQTDNTVENTKEIILQIVETWFVWAKETKNYGFFSQILNAFLEKIHKDAKAREAELNDDLAVYLEKNKEYESNEAVAGIVEQIRGRISQQNYAAAEDLLNRLIRDDLDPEEEALQQTDYLLEFLDEYDINYKRTANSGTTLKSLISSFRSNKDTRGANKLLENWPKGAGVGENTIRIFLSALGFDADTVKTEPRLQGKIESYLVTLKSPENGRKSNYKHPIAAFGSEAETKGFRVVCLFGKTDASRLIDTFKEIGNAKNTLVLLDYALSLSDRRILARKTKTDLSGKIFAVLDRVAVLYLAKHYAETAVNRMLMHIVMPFASYQPYINKSADVMPPEIFIGRRKELEKIESSTGVNLVYGGRQLGKTALLRMAKKDIDKNENGDRAIIVDAREKDYRETAKAVSAALYDEGIVKKENITDDWNVLARDIKNRLRDTEGPIQYFLLMIDEADTFIESCDAVNYQPFDALKDIQSIGEGRFKFVVAGLRNIVRFKQASVLKNNIGLVHLESLTVKPFKAMEARELLEVPLSYLGFRFPKDNDTEVLISTIFGTTNYFPGLLQLYCTKMIEAIRRDYAGYSESETPPYYVKKEHIKKVLAEQSLQDDIYDKFLITLKVDDDDYYYIIALLVAYHYHENRSSNGCNAQELLDLADAFSIKKITELDTGKLTALMEEMRELNVLQYTGDGRYRFTRHSFCQMMGTTQHIDDELVKYMED